MAFEEVSTCNYHSGLCLLLRAIIILSETCSNFQNDINEDSKVDNRSRKKIDFADLVKAIWKSVAGFFSLPPISSQTE